MSLIRDAIRGTPLYTYYLSHPENEFLQTLMDKSFDIDHDLYYPNSCVPKEAEMHFSTYLCYHHIVKNQLNIIYDIISDITYKDLRLLGRVAIEENNKEIIELLHRSGLIFDYCDLKAPKRYSTHGPKYISILTYAYQKHGSEIIKLMHDIGINLNYGANSGFYDCIAHDIDLISYLSEKMESLTESFTCFFRKSKDPLSIVKVFEDKTDMIKRGNEIFCASANKSVEVIKSLLEYGIVITSNAPLASACMCNNIELVEFYLQYGLQVDANILNTIIKSNRFDKYVCITYKSIFELFLKYDVDFSVLNDDDEDNNNYDNFFADLENHGLNKNVLLKKLLFA